MALKGCKESGPRKGLNVPYPGRLVEAARCQGLSFGREGNAAHGVGMASERGHDYRVLEIINVAQMCGTANFGRGQYSTVRGKGNIVDLGMLDRALELRLRWVLDIPDPCISPDVSCGYE